MDPFTLESFSISAPSCIGIDYPWRKNGFYGMVENMKITQEHQEVHLVERRINDMLYSICLAVTYVAIGMSLVRFFSRGEYVSDEINLFYFGVLGLYSLHKEAMHWLMEKEELASRRKGEYFVFLWLILTLVLYVINFATNGHFVVSEHGGELHTLKEITFTALEVGAIFVASRFLKIMRMHLSNRINGISPGQENA